MEKIDKDKPITTIDVVFLLNFYSIVICISKCFNGIDLSYYLPTLAGKVLVGRLGLSLFLWVSIFAPKR